MIIDTIQAGLQFYQNYSENEKVKKAFRERLRRGLRFNREILSMLDKESEPENQKKYIKLLKIDLYKYLVESMIGLASINNDGEKSRKEDIEKTCQKLDFRNNNFLRWSNNIKSKNELIERIYMRIEVLKELSSIDKIKKEMLAISI